MTTLKISAALRGLFVLHTIAIITVALARVPEPRTALAFALGGAMLIAIAVACSEQLSRKSYVPGNGTQAVQIAIAAAMTLWWLNAYATAVPIVLGVAVVLVRAFSLTTRRALYWDLGVVLTLFYASIGADALEPRVVPYRTALALVFLTALIFVLMADYTDRRLNHVRVGDERALRRADRCA